MSGRSLLVLVLAWASAARAEQAAAPPSSPDEVIAEIRTRNPDLESISASIAAARHVGPRVGSLPDPMFSVGLSNLPLSTDQTPLTGVQFELSQTFPWVGKLAAREEVADHDVAIGAARLDQRRNALVARGRALLWELAFLGKQRELALDIKATLRRFAQVAEAIYTSGSGRQQDLIKPVVEQHRIDEMVIGIDRQADMLVSELNALRLRPAASPIQAPKLDEAAALAAPPKVETLLQQAERTSPLLKMRAESISKQESALRLARKDYYPDVTVGLQYRLRWVETMDAVHGADFVGVGVGLNLPVYFGSKQGEREEEVLSLIQADESRLDNARASLGDQIQRTLAAIARDRAQAEIYRTKIIPDTEKALDSSLGDYKSGKLELLSVLDNLTVLFQARVDLVRRLTRIEASRAQLEYLLGAPLSYGAPAPQQPDGGSK